MRNRAAVVATDPPADASPVAGFGKRDETTETLAETPAPELPKAFRARAEQQRRLRRAAAHGPVWAGIASAFVALLTAGWLFLGRGGRTVSARRRCLCCGRLAGAIRPDWKSRPSPARAAPGVLDRVLVSGALRNVRSDEIVAPPVRLALFDIPTVPRSAMRWCGSTRPPSCRGKVQGFAVLIADPGSKAAGVDVVFLPREAVRRPTPPAG